jgi:Uma2 family endonuclease
MDGGATGGRAHRFMVTEYHRMAEAGILGEDSRVELIRGQIVAMAPVGAPHLAMVNRLTRLLRGVVGGRGILSVRNPVQLDDGSEPEPDLAVLTPRADDYEMEIPRAQDVLLIIEVADSSLQEDRERKMPLYAESGVPECWLVNLIDRLVEVHRQPADGLYTQITPVRPGGILDIVALPGASLLAEDLFPQRRR